MEDMKLVVPKSSNSPPEKNIQGEDDAIANKKQELETSSPADGKMAELEDRRAAKRKAIEEYDTSESDDSDSDFSDGLDTDPEENLVVYDHLKLNDEYYSTSESDDSDSDFSDGLDTYSEEDLDNILPSIKE
ncbi:Uncharacterized protein Adt_24543 [Abeliophyllum distichum]|uniref:Uncharacterized protein n=1 Tax=Abeliophyllum distichum TaxID=126358 RepID=A0ABD1SE23_9LAMI